MTRVSTLVSQLVGRQLVREEMPQDGTPGRPAARLSLNPERGWVIGLDIGSGHSRAVLTDLLGRVHASAIHRSEPVPDREIIVRNIVRLVKAVCLEGGRAYHESTALGIGLAGIVNTQSGVVLGWPSTPAWAEGWIGLDVPATLGDQLGIEPIAVDDIVRALGANAQRFGAARNSRNFLYVFLGNGIGSGVFIDGRPYSGSSGIAGELGHVAVDEEGPWCSCGNRGCLEVMASTSAILRRARERLSEPRLMSVLREPHENNSLTIAGLIEAAHQGDKLAYQILDETGAYVGQVLAIALNLLGPELVVLGGPLAQGDSIILNAVQRQVRLHALQHISRHTRIVCDDQGELAGAQGAAILALDRLFSTPEYMDRLL
jgi:predicted NBD/HSP70 family sugar kinase